ncbi:MAG TPA: hypothetical protein ENI70_00250, partial [Candidatus Peregrinibacteria bacterium]|nr:hypothetical protein [Candidatus Peregrinibacteria bacterium]
MRVPTHITPGLKKDIEVNKSIAALSYCWIMSVIIYALHRESPFVRFHAKQGIILFILSIIVWFLPYGRYIEVLVIGLMIAGFFEAVHGSYHPLPIIHEISTGGFNLRKIFHAITRGFA